MALRLRRRKLRGPGYARGVARKFRGRMAMARRRMGAPSVYKFKEPYFGSSTVINVGPNNLGSGIIVGQLSQLANFASYKNLFDLYRITGMKVTFLPTANVASTSVQDINAPGGGWVIPGQLPYLHIAPNRDPLIPAPVNVTDILNDDGVKTVRLDRKRSFYIKYPKADVLMPDGTTHLPLIFANKIQPWLQTGGNSASVDQSALKHYGFRWVIDNTYNNNTYAVDTHITLYFQLKERD